MGYLGKEDRSCREDSDVEKFLRVLEPVAAANINDWKWLRKSTARNFFSLNYAVGVNNINMQNTGVNILNSKLKAKVQNRKI